MANLSPKGIRPAPTDATSSAKPTHSVRVGTLSVAVFLQEIETASEKKQIPSISLRRSYRTSDGKWEHTHSLRQSDLLPAAHALVECFSFLAKQAIGDEE